MAPGTAINVEKKESFFTDAAFKSLQEQLKTSMKDILKRAGVKNATDEYAAYRSQREKNTTDDNQAIISTEHDDHYKVLIDMQDFKGDVSIKSINDDSIMVECHKKKKSGTLVRTYQRRIVFPGHINLEGVMSNLSKEGILSIFAPKRIKDTRKTIPISKYGLFFSDSYFEDYRPHFATAIKDIVKMTKAKNVKDTLSFYRKLRKESGKEEEQAIISVDDSQSYKIVLDMSKFKPDDITIKILDNNDLMVEVKEKKKDGTVVTKGFRRQCVLPDNLDLDKLSSAISSDGILTITAPLKTGQTVNNVTILPAEVKDKLKIGGSLAIKQQGSFFTESMFEEVRQTFTSAVTEVLKLNGVTDTKDQMAAYRSQREKKVSEANQAIISKECSDYYKIMLDMKEFDLTGDVRVKRLNKDTIMVESYRKKVCVFRRCFVLPHNVAIEAASADISSDGILTITAPKKSMMPTLRSVPIERGGLFFVDEKFTDYRPHMKNAMKDVVHANGITEYEDEVVSYRELRKKSKKEDDMAAITHEERKSCKISFDMEEHKDGEIKVYVLSNNDLLIEVYQKKDGTTSLIKTFSRHFVLPNYIEMEHITSMLSSDGILTVYAPRKGVPLKKKGQKDDKEEDTIPEHPVTKTTVNSYFSITTKGVFSSDEAFTDVQSYLDTALSNVLIRGGVKTQGDKRSIYKTHRQQLKIEENQAVLSTEIGSLYKIVLDMHDFMVGDIKVKLLSGNNILVQAFKEKNAAPNATPYFQRRFVFPYHIDVEAVSCLLSSDGVLTVTAPKKPEVAEEDGPVTKTVPVTETDTLFFDNTDDKFKDFRPKFKDAVLEMLRAKGLKPKDEDIMQHYKDLYEKTQDEDNLVAINSEEATTYKMAVDIRDFLNGIHRVHVLSFNDLLVEVVEKKKDGKALRRQFILPNRINMDALTSDLSKDGILVLNAPRTDIKVSKMIEKWEGPREASNAPGDRKSNVKMGTFFTLTKREGFFDDNVFSDVRPHYEAAARNVLKRSDVMTKDDNVSFYNQFRETNRKNEEKRAVISNETDSAYKIIIDMSEFKDEEIRVKMLATNNLIVECVTKADQLRCFYRRFIFPHKVCVEEVHSDLSSDGVLTVTVTKTFATQSSRKVSFKKKVGETGKAKTLAFKGLRNF